jgi:hypothetical protein
MKNFPERGLPEHVGVNFPAAEYRVEIVRRMAARLQRHGENQLVGPVTLRGQLLGTIIADIFKLVLLLFYHI